jgi:prophage antirepressor-like protein
MDHFYFGKHKFTVLHGKDGSRWLVGRELCDYLRLSHTTNAVKELPDDCKQKVVIEAFKSKGHGGDNGNPYGNILSKKSRPALSDALGWTISKYEYSCLNQK